MDLSTSYLGIDLPHPFMAGASPLTFDLDEVRRLEDAGAAAIVMHSLFEEQVPAVTGQRTVAGGGVDAYLEQLRRVRAAVHCPVIASLNGVTDGGWLALARDLEEAGAHALELNVYAVTTNPEQTPADVEERIVSLVQRVARAVGIPVAVKLSPYWTALANLALRLEGAGARGLVLFNRFLQPDIDIEAQRVSHELELSDPSELRLRLRWLAILSGRTSASLAVSGGVHAAGDALKAILAGADAVQMVSALLRNGPEHLRAVREGVGRWLMEHQHDSLADVRGRMGLARCPDPDAFERGNYLRMLQGWRAG